MGEALGLGELVGTVVLDGTGKVTSIESMPPLPASGCVEIGGTSAVVVELTSGMAFATLIAPEASKPIPSAEAAVTAIQCGAAGDIGFSFLGARV